MEKLVSIIILNFNRYQDALECLRSLTFQTHKNFEILIVDNGSKSNLFLKLKEGVEYFKNYLKIKLIRSELNLYFGAGNNKAIKISNGDYICLLNADTEVEPDFIEKMVRFLESNPQAGMISPKIRLYKEKEYIWNAGNTIDFTRPGVAQNKGYLIHDPDNTKYNQIEVTDFAAGTALFVRKKYLEKIGLIDEIYFMYWEDPDWNFRAKMEGFESYFVPTTTVYHKIPIKQELNYKRQVFNNFFFRRNIQIFVWKFAPIRYLLIFYIKFIYYSAIEIKKNLREKRFYLTFLQLVAIWQGFRIGLKRRTNRSCGKYIVKDYKFSRNLQKLLQ
jgi:GT2 family glycosyltransferase